MSVIENSSAVSANPTPNCSAGTTCTITFTFTGDYYQWSVPSGVTSATIDMSGAQGGGNSSGSYRGKGGRVQATLTVTPSSILYLFPGGSGTNSNLSGAVTPGGWNGGGAGGRYPTTGGGGGGASDIRVGGTALSNRVLVAGGAGGFGFNGPATAGGHGGGLKAQWVYGTSSCVTSTESSFTNEGSTCEQPTSFGSVYFGYGGTQTAGGQVHHGSGSTDGWTGGVAGSLGTGGDGGINTSACGSVCPGGGGGGGYYGGAGGGAGPGGGGSSFADPVKTSGVTHTRGYRSGDGVIAITYLNSPTPTTFSTSQSTPTNASTSATFTYSLIFSQSVTGLEASDFQFAAGGASCNTPSVSGSSATYTISVTNCSEGLLTLQLKANSVNGTSVGPPSVSSANAITIDRTAPTVASVTAPSNGTYSPTGLPTGSALTFSVVMSESVTVTGAPRLTLTIGSTSRNADYISQSDSRTLTFRYTITTSSSDIDTDGIALSSTLNLNSGAITDLAGNTLSNTSLTAAQALPSLTSVLVAQRAAAPTITSIDAGNNQLTVNFTAGANNGSTITNYKYSLSGGAFTAMSPVDTTTPLVITSGLSNGTSYAVRILAVTAVGDGESSTAISATPTAIVVANGSNITTSYGRIDTSTAFTASGGTSPYTFSLSPLVTGITINATTGVVTTTATLAVGTYTTNVVATDNASRSGQKAITVTVGKATPTFSFWNNVTKTFGDSPYRITAPTVTGSIAGTFTYSSSNTSVISISTDTATVVGAGSATITATFTPSDSANYDSATTTQTVTVNKATQTITFAPLANKTLGMATFTLSATSSSGLTVTFASVDLSKCTVATTTITLLAAGTCTITASQLGNANYDSATPISRSFTISPTLSITTPNSGLSGTYTSSYTLTLSVTGGSGGNTFTLASGTLPAGLSLDASLGVISGTASTAGSRSITIQVSDSNGATATTSSFTITITQLTPTISLALAGGVSSTPVGASITITASVSQNGSVTFKLGGSAISGCSNVASSLGSATCSWTPASLGSASLTADLSPTDSTNYSSATSSALVVSVVSGTTTITLTVTGGSITKGATRSILASTTSIAGKVTFRINGRTIRGCINRTVASGEATCTWRIALHGSQRLSATFNPTSGAYQSSNASINVVALRRSGPRS